MQLVSTFVVKEAFYVRHLSKRGFSVIILVHIEGLGLRPSHLQ